METPRLRSLPAGARLGLLCLCVVVLIGLGASATHLYWHYEKRDERAGLTYDDIAGAYHGMSSVAPLRSALERGHPEALPADQREAMMTWLLGARDAAGNRPGSNPRLSTQYDDPDLGDLAPAEIISRSCLECHARGVADKHPIAKKYPLETWDDVRSISVSREIKPTDPKKLIISVHAHALSLGCLSLVLSVLLWCSTWPRGLVSAAVLLAGAGLLADFAGQLLSRQYPWAVGVLVGGGGVYNAVTVLMVLGIMVELVRPAKKGA